MLKSFKIGGIHPPENKQTKQCAIKQIPTPKEITVSMSQHIGAPAECCVKRGDHVAKYQLIGKKSGFVSANVHSPVSGTVKRVDSVKNAFGFSSTSVVISPDGDETAELQQRSNEQIAALSAADIIAIIDEAGIVGLGGATFPTCVKLTPPKDMPVDTLVINGAECEPFLTADQRLMEEHPDEIVEGVAFLMRAISVEVAFIAVENNKPDAIRALQKAVKPYPGISVAPLKVKYPQGGEKQLIEAVTGRVIPSGGLPASVGVVVQNVATAFAVEQAVRGGIPLVERVVTVTGLGLTAAGNFMVPLGTPITDLIELAGGIPEDTGKVILGGPMMGKAASNLSASTTKGTSGILVVPERMAYRDSVEHCVRCASCVAACPMGLEPYLIARLSELKDYDRLEHEHVADCIECGSCSYVCISHRPLLDYIRMGKQRTIARIKLRNKK